MFYDRGNHHDFLSLVRQLAQPGELTESTVFPFEFLQVDKPYETYTGTNVRLRYGQGLPPAYSHRALDVFHLQVLHSCGGS